MATTTEGRLDRGTKLARVAKALGVVVIANDFTALSVAVPQIEQDLSTDLTTAQWVINGYALVFGVLIVTGGAVAHHAQVRDSRASVVHVAGDDRAQLVVFADESGLVRPGWLDELPSGWARRTVL